MRGRRLETRSREPRRRCVGATEILRITTGRIPSRSCSSSCAACRPGSADRRTFGALRRAFPKLEGLADASEQEIAKPLRRPWARPGPGCNRRQGCFGARANPRSAARRKHFAACVESLGIYQLSTLNSHTLYSPEHFLQLLSLLPPFLPSHLRHLLLHVRHQAGIILRYQPPAGDFCARSHHNHPVRDREHLPGLLSDVRDGPLP